MNKFDSRDKTDTVSSWEPEVCANYMSKIVQSFPAGGQAELHYKLAKKNSDLSLNISCEIKFLQGELCRSKVRLACLKAFLTPLYTSAFYERNVPYEKPD